MALAALVFVAACGGSGRPGGAANASKATSTSPAVDTSASPTTAPVPTSTADAALVAAAASAGDPDTVAGTSVGVLLRARFEGWAHDVFVAVRSEDADRLVPGPGWTLESVQRSAQWTPGRLDASQVLMVGGRWLVVLDHDLEQGPQGSRWQATLTAFDTVSRTTSVLISSPNADTVQVGTLRSLDASSVSVLVSDAVPTWQRADGPLDVAEPSEHLIRRTWSLPGGAARDDEIVLPAAAKPFTIVRTGSREFLEMSTVRDGVSSPVIVQLLDPTRVSGPLHGTLHRELVPDLLPHDPPSVDGIATVVAGQSGAERLSLIDITTGGSVMTLGVDYAESGVVLAAYRERRALVSIRGEASAITTALHQGLQLLDPESHPVFVDQRIGLDPRQSGHAVMAPAVVVGVS